MRDVSDKGAVGIAGNHIVVPAADFTPELLDSSLRRHVHGTVSVNQVAFGHMRDHGGRVVNTGSSVEAAGQRRGSTGDAASAASKGRNDDPALDLAPAFVFLASDVSRYVTGQILAADRGLHMFD